jgi:dienelactone hydrolase
MIGIIVLAIAILVELIFSGVKIWKKQSFKKEKCIINLVELFLFIFLILIQVIDFSFRWKVLLIVLIARGILAVVNLIRSKETKYKALRTVITCLGSVIIMFIAIVPALIFPQREQVPVSGEYAFETKSYTWEDVNRIETFKTDGSNRNVTVQFWYPKTDKSQKFPLVIFSHGAYGVRTSNTSTYEELASNGYVVCSIEHTYHAFITRQTDGKIIKFDSKFVKSVSKINTIGTTENEIFDITRKWMNVRCGDMNFVIDTIEKKVNEASSDDVFKQLDVSKIGIMGHSLGGATAVTVGRQRDDIDAVIDLDGSMLGEEMACVNGVYTMNEEPYPVPLLCIDTTGHYKQGLSYGSQYVNNVILDKALDAKEVHFDGAEHMNFTDLPLFSPFLASKLGMGDIDSMDCIRTMNGLILNYYNHYLKQSEELNINDSY